MSSQMEKSQQTAKRLITYLESCECPKIKGQRLSQSPKHMEASLGTLLMWYCLTFHTCNKTHERKASERKGLFRCIFSKGSSHGW